MEKWRQSIVSINSEHLLIIPAKLPFFVKAPAKMSVFFLAVGRIRAVGVVPVLFQPPFLWSNIETNRSCSVKYVQTSPSG